MSETLYKDTTCQFSSQLKKHFTSNLLKFSDDNLILFNKYSDLTKRAQHTYIYLPYYHKWESKLNVYSKTFIIQTLAYISALVWF